MKTILLPGFSERNKIWASEIKEAFAPEIELSVHTWPHWETGAKEEGWMDKEVEKILAIDEPIAILAKSIGTLIAVKTLQKKPDMVKKLLICGVPLRVFEGDNDTLYQALSLIGASNILCIQNSEDDMGSYREVEAFIHAIDPSIMIISKERNDHHYPYPEDFKKFFTS